MVTETIITFSLFNFKFKFHTEDSIVWYGLKIENFNLP